MSSKLLLVIASAAVLAEGLNAQEQPAYYRVVNCVKAATGKYEEYRHFAIETGRKMAEVRAKAGEISTWALLRNVMPAGDEARCDFRISTTFEGAPPKARSPEALAGDLKKAGIDMTVDDYLAKRNSLSRLVATEMWVPRIIVGQPEKGHYLLLNHMKVIDAAGYYKLESETWRPLAEAWVKEGTQSGWQFSTILLPGGSEVKYAAQSADIYPSWEAVFKPRNTEAIFKQVHPGKDYQETMGSISKLRDLAQRELLYIEERVARK
jgi:hypothetical protein